MPSASFTGSVKSVKVSFRGDFGQGYLTGMLGGLIKWAHHGSLCHGARCMGCPGILRGLTKSTEHPSTPEEPRLTA